MQCNLKLCQIGTILFYVFPSNSTPCSLPCHDDVYIGGSFRNNENAEKLLKIEMECGWVCWGEREKTCGTTWGNFHVFTSRKSLRKYLIFSSTQSHSSFFREQSFSPIDTSTITFHSETWVIRRHRNTRAHSSCQERSSLDFSVFSEFMLTMNLIQMSVLFDL